MRSSRTSAPGHGPPRPGVGLEPLQAQCVAKAELLGPVPVRGRNAPRKRASIRPPSSGRSSRSPRSASRNGRGLRSPKNEPAWTMRSRGPTLVRQALEGGEVDAVRHDRRRRPGRGKRHRLGPDGVGDRRDGVGAPQDRTGHAGLGRPLGPHAAPLVAAVRMGEPGVAEVGHQARARPPRDARPHQVHGRRRRGREHRLDAVLADDPRPARGPRRATTPPRGRAGAAAARPGGHAGQPARPVGLRQPRRRALALGRPAVAGAVNHGGRRDLVASPGSCASHLGSSGASTSTSNPSAGRLRHRARTRCTPPPPAGGSRRRRSGGAAFCPPPVHDRRLPGRPSRRDARCRRAGAAYTRPQPRP